MATGAVSRANRRRIVSPWFKRQMLARIALVGFVALAAVCLAFGAVGVAVGAAVLVGVAGMVRSRRLRRWRTPPPTFDSRS